MGFYDNNDISNAIKSYDKDDKKKEVKSRINFITKY